MNFTSKYLPISSGLEVFRRFPHWPLLFFILVANGPALAVGIVTQVKGTVTVKLPNFSAVMPLRVGTQLPDDADAEFDGGSQFSVLCLESGKPMVFRAKDDLKNRCDSQWRKTMRSGPNSDVPFLLIPNQTSLNRIDRVLWTGPEKAHYSLELIHSNIDGKETPLKKWRDVQSHYNNSGIHEFRLDKPLPLAFREEGERYLLVVTNNDNTRSSLDHSRFYHAVETPVAAQVKADAIAAVKDLNIDDSQLRHLVLAAHLALQGYWAEAYEFLDDVSEPALAAQKQLLKARLLHLPGAPLDVLIKEYGLALELAAGNDDLNAVIACEGVSNKSPILSDESRSYQQQIISNPRYKRYCPTT